MADGTPTRDLDETYSSSDEEHEELTLYVGSACDFVEQERYDEFSEWICELGEDEIMLLNYPSDEQVDDAWVSTDQWGGGEHLFWSVGNAVEPDGDGLLGAEGMCELVVTTKPPRPDAEGVKTIVVTDAEMTENGRPRFLTLIADTVSYYEVWMGKTLFWRCDYGHYGVEDKEEESGIITWAAETRKEYLDSVEVDKPWKPLARELQFGGLVDPDSPAHPRGEARRRRRELVAWRFAINKERREATLRKRRETARERARAASAAPRAAGGKRRAPEHRRLGAAVAEEGRATRQPTGPEPASAAARLCLYVSRGEDMPSGHRIDLDGPDGNVFSIMARLIRNFPGQKEMIEGLSSETYEQVVRVASAMLPKTTFFTRDGGLAGRINCVGGGE